MNMYIKEYRENGKYDKIFNYALTNWLELSKQATHYKKGDKVISIADQLINKFNCPRVVADDIANSISISLALEWR